MFELGRRRQWLPAPAAGGDAPDHLPEVGFARPPVSCGFAAVLPLATHPAIVDLTFAVLLRYSGVMTKSQQELEA